MALKWKLLAGDIIGIRLRHQASPGQLGPDFATVIKEWGVLRDDIDTQETLVEINNDFDIWLFNSFILLPYEDAIMRDNNGFSGKPVAFTIQSQTVGHVHNFHLIYSDIKYTHMLYIYKVNNIILQMSLMLDMFWLLYSLHY